MFFPLCLVLLISLIFLLHRVPRGSGPKLLLPVYFLLGDPIQSFYFKCQLPDLHVLVSPFQCLDFGV